MGLEPKSVCTKNRPMGTPKCTHYLLWPPPDTIRSPEDLVDACAPHPPTREVSERSYTVGECLPGARPARYFSINYPDFSPRFTLSWRSPPSRPHCTAHLPCKARCIIKQYL